MKLSDFIQAPRPATCSYNGRAVVFNYRPHVLTPIFWDNLESEADKRPAQGKPGDEGYKPAELDGAYLSRKMSEFVTSFRWADEPEAEAVTPGETTFAAFPLEFQTAILLQARRESQGMRSDTGEVDADTGE